MTHPATRRANAADAPRPRPPAMLALALTLLAALTVLLAIAPAPARAGADVFVDDGKPAPACQAAGTGTGAAKAQPDHKIREAGFLRVGGIAQWVTIQGERCANPVVLMVHGGPGNPMSPFADALYGAWEKDFTLVQWDQRGAGMTYGRNPPAEGTPLTLDQLTADGVAVAEFITRHLGQPRLILMGSSWGSVLAVHMVQRRPDLFQAYVGTAQLVSQQANQAAFYSRLLALAQAAGDAKTVATLTTLGPPPWRNPRAFGQVRRASRVYEAKVTVPAPTAWWQPAAPYATPKALEDAEQGEDYSWLQFVGLQDDGMFSRVDLPRLGTRFAVPVYIVQGEQDLLTPLQVTQPYFDSIQAPAKALVLVPQAGHDPNPPLVEAQYKLLKARFSK